MAGYAFRDLDRLRILQRYIIHGLGLFIETVMFSFQRDASPLDVRGFPVDCSELFWVFTIAVVRALVRLASFSSLPSSMANYKREDALFTDPLAWSE